MVNLSYGTMAAAWEAGLTKKCHHKMDQQAWYHDGAGGKSPPTHSAGRIVYIGAISKSQPPSSKHPKFKKARMGRWGEGSALRLLALLLPALLSASTAIVHECVHDTLPEVRVPPVLAKQLYEHMLPGGQR